MSYETLYSILYLQLNFFAIVLLLMIKAPYDLTISVGTKTQFQKLCEFQEIIATNHKT